MIEEYKEESDSDRRRYLLTSFLCHCPLEELDLVFAFLAGKKEKAILEEDLLVTLASEYLDQPLWMIRSAIEEVGEISEAISLLTGNPSPNFETEFRVLLKKANQIINSKDQSREVLFSIWKTFSISEKIFFHKLLLGKQNLKIQETFLIEILADLFDLETGVLLNKFRKSKIHWKTISIVEILSSWFPDRKLERLNETEILKRIDPSLPQKPPRPSSFSENRISEKMYFLLCPKGISAEVILSPSEVFIWTKDGFLYPEETPLIFQEFSEVKRNARILGWISQNQKGERIFLFYDILNYENENLSSQSIKERKEILDLILNRNFQFVRPVEWNGIPEEIDSIDFQKNFLIESRSAFLFYPEGKFFSEFKTPLQTIKAVLIYGRKAMNKEGSSFWELSFGVPTHLATHREQDAELLATQDSNLNTIARISVDSKHSLFLEIDSFFKENTIEKKGPIRGVPTIWKAELSFQKLLPSKRHKMGFVLEDVKILGKISSEESIDSLDLLLKLRNSEM
ncbi:hypothetical protein A0128_17985 [Leptospira tipperaryensis]|uniref:DNA ligase ATP-dependent N-terminal domain-containing protein n=1 Tax=Leptospira tipperaryensis TaxID=2564040 RepID=A0A1D7V142_9LEPT|nr:hypothetical protein A0128_17985 [Leptospira tipperaryensis]